MPLDTTFYAICSSLLIGHFLMLIGLLFTNLYYIYHCSVSFVIFFSQESGTLYVSLDANFGLVRKHNAGQSVTPPKHGTRLFAKDEDVFTYVEKAKNKPLPNVSSFVLFYATM